MANDPRYFRCDSLAATITLAQCAVLRQRPLAGQETGNYLEHWKIVDVKPGPCIACTVWRGVETGAIPTMSLEEWLVSLTLSSSEKTAKPRNPSPASRWRSATPVSPPSIPLQDGTVQVEPPPATSPRIDPLPVESAPVTALSVESPLPRKQQGEPPVTPAPVHPQVLVIPIMSLPGIFPALQAAAKRHQISVPTYAARAILDQLAQDGVLG